MMQELENHQQKQNSLQQRAEPQHSTEMQPVVSSGSEKRPSSNPTKTSARRSLDYSGFLVRKEQESDASSNHAFDGSRSGERRLNLITGDHEEQGVDDSVTQQVDAAETKKRVRIVSPGITTSRYEDEELHPSASHHQNVSNSADVHDDSSEGLRTSHVTPPSSISGKPSPVSVRSRDRMQPSSGENQARMIQYLVDELRALLGSTGQWRTLLFCQCLNLSLSYESVNSNNSNSQSNDIILLWFSIATLCDWLKNFALYFLNQSEAKPTVTCTHAFSRA